MAIKTEYRRILLAAKAMAHEAGKILKSGFNRKLRIRYKGRIDPVTEYDLKSEKLLIGRIKKLFLGHAVLAEESALQTGQIDTVSEAEYRWVIDPLDGSAGLDICYLAAGRLDGFWELKLYPWDTAAALIILSEAGGQYSRIRGGSYSIFDDELLASNRSLPLAMRKVLVGQS